MSPQTCTTAANVTAAGVVFPVFSSDRHVLLRLGLVYKYLLPAADLLFSSLHIFLHALPKNQNQESHASAFSGSDSLLKTTTGTMYGLAALSKTSTITVMIKLTRTLSHAALRRSVGRLCIKSSTGTAAHFLTHTLLFHDSLKQHAQVMMI